MHKKVLLAGGCFWGIEARFQAIPGVISTQVGYCGGNMENPTYQDVCKEITGHVETVEVTYDDAVVSLKQLLEAFFQFHDPTDAAYPGLDYASQYRSMIFYESDDERDIAEEVIAFLDISGLYDRPIVTRVIPACTFFPAEEYHQHYYEKHGLSVFSSDEE